MSFASLTNRSLAWARAHTPTQEGLASSRWLRPFASHLGRADLWRFSRRSVPRGVALGLFVGVLIPFAHTVIAALTAPFVRANIAVAAVTTWSVNPLTMGPLYWAAWHVGHWLLGVDARSPVPPMAHHASGNLWHALSWLLSTSAPIALGLVVLSCLVSGLGYLGASLVWRLRVARRWRRRMR